MDREFAHEWMEAMKRRPDLMKRLQAAAWVEKDIPGTTPEKKDLPDEKEKEKEGEEKKEGETKE
jgi:hypothetical protein